MRLLYVAAGIEVPGTHGGSIHTWEVAHGLAELGHDVHILACRPHHPQPDRCPNAAVGNRIQFHYSNLPKALSLAAYPTIAALVRRLAPDAVIERYYNLGGAGVLAARRCHVPILLEVNALIVDPPAVFKRRLDDRLGGPLRRWAVWQCRAAARIVTPLATTVPAEVDRARIVELPWGANVERFAPATDVEATAALRQQLRLPADRPVVVFSGSFRTWHGVQDFVTAAVHLLEAGASYAFLLIGDGPERAAAERIAAPYRNHFRFVGRVPYDAVPGYLALAQVGVAPFNTAHHPALRAAGFFWSPLKIYEYMAMGLPVVTPRIPPLDTTIRDGVEGTVYPEGDTVALAEAIRARTRIASARRDGTARPRTRRPGFLVAASLPAASGRP